MRTANSFRAITLFPVTDITAQEPDLGLASSWMSLKKKFLLLTFGALAALATPAILGELQVRATSAERTKNIAGDNLIPYPVGVVNHAIMIHRPPVVAQRGEPCEKPKGIGFRCKTARSAAADCDGFPNP
jgi:hypothetical protein